MKLIQHKNGSICQVREEPGKPPPADYPKDPAGIRIWMDYYPIDPNRVRPGEYARHNDYFLALEVSSENDQKIIFYSLRLRCKVAINLTPAMMLKRVAE